MVKDGVYAVFTEKCRLVDLFDVETEILHSSPELIPTHTKNKQSINIVLMRTKQT